MKLTIDQLTVTYRDGDHALLALDRVSLTLESGRITALVGESGSGKTTLGKTLMGLLPDNAESTGCVKLDEKEIIGMDEASLNNIRWSRVAMVFQNGLANLNPAHRIVMFNRALARLSGWSAGEVLGRHHDTTIQWARLETQMDLPTAVASGWPSSTSRPLYVEGDLRRSNGGTISVGITYAPLFDREGRLVNTIGNVRDITRFREADEIKSTFISVISHELKTPVALVKGYADTLLREDAHWDQQTMHESLTVILEEADRLNDLIDNLLDASRLQAGGLPLAMDQVAFDALAESVTSRFSTQTEAHAILVSFPPDFPPVLGDHRRLEQVLSNLLSNAIKYSPEGGRIEISGRVLPNEVVITVSDEGTGIPIEEQTRVFERFFRGARAHQQGTAGAGLGLYLAKAIVEAHDGRMWVESAPGEGASFSFSVPRDRPSVEQRT